MCGYTHTHICMYAYKHINMTMLSELAASKPQGFVLLRFSG